MPYLTTCRRCGRLYDERSRDAADVPAWAATGADRLCPECWAFEQRDARIRAELDAGRLPDPDDLTAQVAHIEREGAAALAALRELADQPAGYTVAAADVSPRDVLDALTAGHEAEVYRAAIARDGLEAVARQELADLIAAGHLIATEDAAQAVADDLTARDDFADPQVLAIDAEDIAGHLVRLGWNEPEPRALFDQADDA